MLVLAVCRKGPKKEASRMMPERPMVRANMIATGVAPPRASIRACSGMTPSHQRAPTGKRAKAASTILLANRTNSARTAPSSSQAEVTRA